MKKILLIVVALLFNSTVFSAEFFCKAEYRGSSPMTVFMTKIIEDNKILDRDRRRKYDKQFADFINNTYHINIEDHGGVWCGNNTKGSYIYYESSGGEATTYKDGYGYSFRISSDFDLKLLNWKPEQLKRQIVKTKPPKRIIANNKDYTNSDWWENATLEQVKRVIRNGLNPNELFGNSKETALHLAISSNNSEIIEYVIKSGANINAKNKHGRTPLDYAEYSKNDETIDTLKRMVKKARYKNFPVANSCITITKGNGSRFPRNDCNFPVAMWACYENNNSNETNVLECDQGLTHFPGLTHMDANSSGGFFPFSSGYTISQITCGAIGERQYALHIYDNKKGETRFGCRKIVYE